MAYLEIGLFADEYRHVKQRPFRGRHGTLRLQERNDGLAPKR